MLETIVAVVALFVCIGLLLFKLYNITSILSNKSFIPKQAVFFSLIGILLCWGLYFLAFAGTMQYTETIVSSTETYTITNSAYLSFAFFMPAMNFFLILGIMLTVIEVLAFYAHIHKRGWRE